MIGTNTLKTNFSIRDIIDLLDYKNASISTYTPKTEFKRFFPTPGDNTFVQKWFS